MEGELPGPVAPDITAADKRTVPCPVLAVAARLVGEDRRIIAQREEALLVDGQAAPGIALRHTCGDSLFRLQAGMVTGSSETRIVEMLPEKVGVADPELHFPRQQVLL